MAKTDSKSDFTWLRISFWCVALALGAADCWATRFTMNPDGVSYLDMGDAYFRGDWHIAVNAYWSPLYSWILGLFLKVLRPSAYWEYPMAHLVNFLIYAAALGSFEFFLRAWIDYRRRSSPEGSEAAPTEWAWWILGYSLFISSSLILITVKVVTPDMYVAAFVYLAFGLILRMRTGTATWRTSVLLGLVLGLAYLAKAVMFPLAFAFIVATVFSCRSGWREIRYAAVSALVFLLVSSPLIATLSRAKGHLTFGDSGKWNYVMFIDGVRPFFSEKRQGQTSG
jgi:hypothetical protein